MKPRGAYAKATVRQWLALLRAAMRLPLKRGLPVKVPGLPDHRGQKRAEGLPRTRAVPGPRRRPRAALGGHREVRLRDDVATQRGPGPHLGHGGPSQRRYHAARLQERRAPRHPGRRRAGGGPRAPLGRTCRRHNALALRLPSSRAADPVLSQALGQRLQGCRTRGRAVPRPAAHGGRETAATRAWRRA